MHAAPIAYESQKGGLDEQEKHPQDSPRPPEEREVRAYRAHDEPATAIQWRTSARQRRGLHYLLGRCLEQPARVGESVTKHQLCRRPARSRVERRGTVLRPGPPARRTRAGTALPAQADRSGVERENQPRQGVRPDPAPGPSGGRLPCDGRAPRDQDAAAPMNRLTRSFISGCWTWRTSTAFASMPCTFRSTSWTLTSGASGTRWCRGS